MATKKCMQCGGAMKKMQKGGSNVKMGIYGIPQENIGTSSQFMPTAKKGGATKNAKLAALAKPKNKITRADIIAGALKKAKFGASVPVQHSPAPGRVRSSSGVGTVAVGARKQMGGSMRKKK